MANLPTEVLFTDLLPKLHPRSLLQFKSFDKSLYDYISSKDFIDVHLKHTVETSNTNRLLMVYTATRSDHKRYLYLVDADSPDCPPRYLQLPPPFCDFNKWYPTTVVGSCNGLLCLKASIIKDLKCCWIILNPCTGKISRNFSTLSTSSDPPTKTLSGFGYDSLKDDYKLVVVEYLYRVMMNAGGRKVSVYSMKANSRITIHTTSLSDPFLKLSLPQCWKANCVLINNHLMHWMLVLSTCNGTTMKNKRKFVCFNLETEQWEDDIALPCFADYFPDYDLGFGVLRGCLCFSINLNNMFVVWIMKDYRVQDSWTVFYIDFPDSKLYRPVFATSNYWKAATLEILFVRKDDESCHQWYNIRDKTFTKFELSGRAPQDLTLESLCLGSLVSDFRRHQKTKTSKDSDKEKRIKVDKQFKISKLDLEQ